MSKKCRCRDCVLWRNGCIINEYDPDADPMDEFGCDAMEDDE